MLYSNYTERIKNIISESKQRKQIEKGFSNYTGLSDMPKSKKAVINEQRTFSNKVQLNAKPLGAILQTSTLPDAKLGLHPDFKHLKQSDETEYHHIVSVFIDIQGSTNLHREYELEDIYRITNTIQNAAIHTCILFGGHVQRLQGDGVFVYFGGKSIDKKSAVEMAVTASSMFTYFVKNDLKNIFLEDGIEDINTRIGIDFGKDDEVLWANFGLMEVSELTTLSLHTSLASKMQAYAATNGIVVGQNIKDLLMIDEGIYDLVRNSKGDVIKRYIFENNRTNFRYTQYAFDWYKFLKTLPYVKSDSNGNLYMEERNPEEERINRLRNTSALIAAGNAFLDKQGNISSLPSGVQHQPHKFHYGSKFFRTHKQQYAKVGILEYHKRLMEERYSFLKYKIKDNVLICSGWVSSNDYLNKYKIEIKCVAGYEPCSKILEPSDIKPSREIHMYPDHTLCLHYPPDMKWSGWTPIYKYTVPWVVEWIHYYELYLVNGGNWEGPESPVHFTENDRNIDEDILDDL